MTIRHSLAVLIVTPLQKGETSKMSQGLDCPVCQHAISSDLVPGAKIVCPACESVHRVRATRAGLHLQTLIEALDPPRFHATAAADGEPSRSEAVGPKLSTWKDRARAETRSGADRRGRSSGLSGRRRSR